MLNEGDLLWTPSRERAEKGEPHRFHALARNGAR